MRRLGNKRRLKDGRSISLAEGIPNGEVNLEEMTGIIEVGQGVTGGEINRVSMIEGVKEDKSRVMRVTLVEVEECDLNLYFQIDY